MSVVGLLYIPVSLEMSALLGQNLPVTSKVLANELFTGNLELHEMPAAHV